MESLEFSNLYREFNLPVTIEDCGKRCSPHNSLGVPFCCDLKHVIPTAYQEEWKYLEENTNLWHVLDISTAKELIELAELLPEGQVMIACLGHRFCQRDFRSIVCRSFPFFPYITRQGELLGLSYYWDYEDRCWVISNLRQVTFEYRQQFIQAFEELFNLYPEEHENFRNYSIRMRRIFGRRKRAIPLLHRNGKAYKVSPRTGRMRKVSLDDFQKFGLYKIAAELPFPNETG